MIHTSQLPASVSPTFFESLVGDRGLSVLVRLKFRPTNASAWLQPPDQLLQFLNSWITATGVLG